MSQLITIAKAKAQLAAVKMLTLVIPAPRPLMLIGADSAINMCTTVAHIGVKHVLIVTDQVLLDLGVIAPVEAALQKQGVRVTIFSGVTPDPTMTVVENGIAVLQANGCDSVLAFGGGSSIDAAKVIALAAANRKTPKQLIGILKARVPSLPLFVIPTTAGTGSEVSIGAVLSDDVTHQKGLVIDPKVVPKVAALDAKIMQGMPRSVTADTGLDALTHALEAWVSDFASDESNYYAGAAVKLIFNNLSVAYETGSDLDAREAMALASHYAGLAFNSAGLGYVHAIAHQLGAFYGVPHGRANATVLPHVLKFNRKVSAKKLATLARLLGLADTSYDDQSSADYFISQVEALIQRVNINTHVDGMKAEDFPAMVKAAMAEAHGIYAVPKYMTPQDAEQILQQIMQG